MRIVLASGSPRRRELLAGLGLTFDVMAADVDESVCAGETPGGYVARLAREKAAAVEKRIGGGAFVIAADTTVSLGEEIFGKPADAAEAARMLERLSGHSHRVTTGVAVATPAGFVADEVVSTQVTMRPLSGDEIRWYVATGEPFDKAGGYAIQGLAAHFITGVHGSVTNVIGLPLSETVLMLRRFGVPVALQGVAS